MLSTAVFFVTGSLMLFVSLSNAVPLGNAEASQDTLKGMLISHTCSQKTSPDCAAQVEKCLAILQIDLNDSVQFQVIVEPDSLCPSASSRADCERKIVECSLLLNPWEDDPLTPAKLESNTATKQKIPTDTETICSQTSAKYSDCSQKLQRCLKFVRSDPAAIHPGVMEVFECLDIIKQYLRTVVNDLIDENDPSLSKAGTMCSQTSAKYSDCSQKLQNCLKFVRSDSAARHPGVMEEYECLDIIKQYLGIVVNDLTDENDPSLSKAGSLSPEFGLWTWCLLIIFVSFRLQGQDGS